MHFSNEKIPVTGKEMYRANRIGLVALLTANLIFYRCLLLVFLVPNYISGVSLLFCTNRFRFKLEHSSLLQLDLLQTIVQMPKAG